MALPAKGGRPQKPELKSDREMSGADLRAWAEPPVSENPAAGPVPGPNRRWDEHPVSWSRGWPGQAEELTAE